MDETFTPAHGADDPGARLADCLQRADPRHARLPAEGAEAAAQAMVLAQGLGRPMEAGRAAAWRCTHLFRLGEFEAADAAARTALSMLEDSALVDERCETLRVLAMINCERGHFSAALEAAQRLGRTAAEIGSSGWALMADYALAVCYDRLGDAWQATRVLEEGIARHGAGATPRERFIASVGMSACLIDSFHRMRDALPPEEGLERLRRALPHAETAVTLLGATPEPLKEVVARGNLGEVLLFLGELEAARPLLQAAMQQARDCGLAGYAQRAEATWCHWLLGTGRAGEARQLADGLLVQVARGGALVTQIRVLDAAYRACRQLGLAQDALEHHEHFERLERRRTLGEMRAMGELFVTRGEAMTLARRADEFERLAQRDGLTGLANRSLLQQRARQLGPRDVLAIVDIDHFKQINDRHGHAAGDAVLVRLAALLTECTRESDLAARTGGEEFVLLLSDIGLATGQEVCERLRLAVEQQAAWPELPAGEGLTISIGLTAADDLSLESATRRADAALYAAKRDGRNRVVVARP
jgi:diguanylate cyclase